MHHEIERMVDDFERGRLSRRQLVRHLTAAAAVLAAGARPATAQPPAAPEESTFQATGVDHLALRVTDVGRSRRFYERHLGLRTTSCGASQCFLSAGRDFLAFFRGDRPGLDHFSFAVPGYRADDAVARLEAAGLKPRRHENRVYFDDPDGLEVQVSSG